MNTTRSAVGNLGIPLCSKILKGGFEEGMVSAFIAAISSFRTEFGMDQTQWDFRVTPISDIISAVPTSNLICAFVTVSTASPAHQIRMAAYGRAAGAMFDDLLAGPENRVLSTERLRMFDSLFFGFMDGSLLQSYKMKLDASFPREMKYLQIAASRLPSDEGFKLGRLAKEMTTCGVEEAMAYKMIADAIQKSLLVSV